MVSKVEYHLSSLGFLAALTADPKFSTSLSGPRRGSGDGRQYTVVVVENVAVSSDRDSRQLFCYRFSFDIDTDASEWAVVFTRTTGQSCDVDGVETLVTSRLQVEK